MCNIRHGLDLVECARIADILARHSERFYKRVLTKAEAGLAGAFRNPVPFVAGRWAAKEALLKMLGTGWRGLIAWTDMEILPDGMGRPVVALSGETKRVAERCRITHVILSITHTEHYAAASAIGYGN